ncbi:hypothetical protein GCM10027570_52480 [Streptomonospora sediminis]
MKKHTRISIIAAAVLLSAGAVGYYAVSKGAAAPEAAEQAAAPTVELPLDSYRPTAAEEVTYDRAFDLLAQRCVADAGFSWPVRDEPPLPENRHLRRYGVIDPNDAQKYGYHLAPTKTPDQKSDKAAPTPEAEAAFYGPVDSPEEGCAAKAERRLDRGAGGADGKLLAELDWTSLDISETHPDVIEAKNAWQECMSARGHSYATPRKAIEDESWNLDSPSPTAAERAVAVADVECKYEVGMVETWVQAEHEIQREMIAEHTSELEALQHANEVRHGNAEAVLAESGEA